MLTYHLSTYNKTFEPFLDGSSKISLLSNCSRAKEVRRRASVQGIISPSHDKSQNKQHFQEQGMLEEAIAVVKNGLQFLQEVATMR